MMAKKVVLLLILLLTGTAACAEKVLAVARRAEVLLVLYQKHLDYVDPTNLRSISTISFPSENSMDHFLFSATCEYLISLTNDAASGTITRISDSKTERLTEVSLKTSIVKQIAPPASVRGLEVSDVAIRRATWNGSMLLLSSGERIWEITVPSGSICEKELICTSQEPSFEFVPLTCDSIIMWKNSEMKCNLWVCSKKKTLKLTLTGEFRAAVPHQNNVVIATTTSEASQLAEHGGERRDDNSSIISLINLEKWNVQNTLKLNGQVIRIISGDKDISVITLYKGNYELTLIALPTFEIRSKAIKLNLQTDIHIPSEGWLKSSDIALFDNYCILRTGTGILKKIEYEK